MNLWVNRLKQLTILSVALFFFSCKDEFNLIGIKNPNSKFAVQYIELPVESSVLLFDTLRASNYFFSGETNRLLVGKTEDAVFGDVTSTTCTQFYCQTGFTKLAATAAFDYATIDLTFDNYTYGASKAATLQDISIYELDQILYDTARGNYNSKTPIPLGAFIANKSFTLDPAILQSYKDDAKDTTLTLDITSNFGQRLFQSALDYRDDIDTTFAYYSLLSKKFPGIAIVPNDCDKVFGFNPTNTKSRISLHYHLTTDTIKRVLTLVFTQAVSFNNISSDRSGTELAGLTTDRQDFKPADSLQYIQSGAGVFTKLDFKAFLKFFNTDSIPNMILNSAELVIGNVEQGGDFDPPSYLALRVLTDDNLEYAYGTKNTQSRTDFAFYKGLITPDIFSSNGSVLIENDSVFSVAQEAGSQLSYTKSDHKYNGYLTRFLQQVYTKAEGKTQLRYFALYPVSPVAAKSVNRVRFPKDNIKLRIYYTLPTVKD